MNKFYTIATLLAAGVLTSTAAVISPDQALNRAIAGSNSQSRVSAAADYKLAFEKTDKATNAPEIYVFAAEDGEPGFIVAAANDEYPRALLGYSAENIFDPNNIPPQAQWWLDVMAQKVASPSTPTIGQRMSVKGKASTAKTDIPPMVSTVWNQSTPFNNMCPTVNGERSVTGCVATAMAQIMDLWHWPANGTGGSVTLSGMTVNFNESTYDWANMIDNYNYSYTTKQANAVAKLMLDCGFASQMSYSPDGSGANDFIAGQGMLKHFSYDKHLQYILRDWYTDQDWANVIYDELYAGRPIMLCGNDGTVGHAFVCDGYQASTDLFHINWGWGGYCDGFFIITELDPEGSGIGGGSGNAGYNRGNSALIGIEPPVDGHSYIPTMAVGKTFATDRPSYSRASDAYMNFVGEFYSYSLTDLDIYIGIKLVPADGGNAFYHFVDNLEIQSGYGIESFPVALSDIPNGKYRVYPVCSTANDYSKGIWYPIHTNNNTKGYVDIDANASTVTVSGDVPEAAYAIQVKSTSPEGHWYPGVNYDVTLDVIANVSTTKDNVYLLLYKGTEICAISDRTVTLATPESNKIYSFTWDLDIPASLPLGKYSLGLAYSDGQYVYLLDGANTTVTVEEDPTNGVANVESIYFVGSPSRGTSPNHPAEIDFTGQININLECTTGPWSERVAGVFYNNSTGDPAGQTTIVPMQLQTGEKSTATVKVDATYSQDMKAGVIYQCIPYADGRGEINSAKRFYVRFTGDLSGVDDINADNDDNAPVEYYNLQGMRIDNPTPGQMLIRRCGNKTSKIIY